jgi:hypothetical protein
VSATRRTGGPAPTSPLCRSPATRHNDAADTAPGSVESTRSLRTRSWVSASRLARGGAGTRRRLRRPGSPRTLSEQLVNA